MIFRDTNTRPSRITGFVFAVGWSAFIGLLTLSPGPGGGPSLPAWCLVCGQHGAADAVLNFVVFVPLGTALAAAMGVPGRAIATGVALTAGIELAQFTSVPGRDSSLGDLLTNSLGTCAGVALWVWRAVLLRPDPAQARLLRALSFLLICTILLAIPLLLRPALPDSVWYGQWTPNLGHLDVYRGRVLSARLGHRLLPPEALHDADAIRNALLGGDTLRVHFVAAPAPAGLAPIFSIYDEHQREVFIIGAAGTDLVLRYRSVGDALRFDSPSYPAPDALGVLPGDTRTVELLWRHPRLLVRMAGRDIPWHVTGPALEHGILLLFASQPQFRRWFRFLAGAAVFLLTLPLGFYARRTYHLGLPLVAVGLIAVMHHFLPIRAPLPSTMTAGAFGAVVGLVLRGRLKSTVAD